VYAGDWIINLLGATMVVGSGLTVVGGTAILFALLRTASGFEGLARARSFPPPGVVDHAEEVRGRIRTRYMLRARSLSNPAASSYVAFEIEAADPIALLIADGATMPITKLPPLNESLRRGLAARAPLTTPPVRPTPAARPTRAVAPKGRAAPKRRRKASRKANAAKSRSTPPA